MSVQRSIIDVKLILLYVLNRISHPVTLSELSAFAQITDGFTYFDIVQALSELLRSGHVDELFPADKPNETTDALSRANTAASTYVSTQKGHDHGEIMERKLPYSLRRLARVNAKSLDDKLKLDAFVAAYLSRQTDN
jgi:hypothetical protein